MTRRSIWPVLPSIVLLGAWCIVALVPSAARAADDTPKLNVSQTKTVLLDMDADPRLASVFALCPADAYIRDAPFYADYMKPTAQSVEACGAAPERCYRHCVANAESGTCFALARAFQLNEDTVSSRYAQMLFAMACDAGMGSGCTNRASSVRNNPVDGDKLLLANPAEQERCEFRSFRIGCNQSDAWSCSMLGQSYQYGEGIAADAGRARRFLQRACAISPTFAACAFAKHHLSEMEHSGQD